MGAVSNRLGTYAGVLEVVQRSVVGDPHGAHPSATAAAAVPQGDVHHWVPLLDWFDAYLEKHVKGRRDLALTYPPTPAAAAEPAAATAAAGSGGSGAAATQQQQQQQQQQAAGGRQQQQEQAQEQAPDPPLPSEALLQGRKTIEISHNGAVYRLQATRQGKLILTK